MSAHPLVHAPHALSFDRGTLVLRGASARYVQAGFPAGLWTWDARLPAWRCDALHYATVRARLALDLGADFQDGVPAPAPVRWPKPELAVLREDQRAALEAWTRAGRRGLIIMPTGTGKTEVALAALAESGVATLVVAPVRDLMYQWHQRILQRLGYDAGILGDQPPRTLVCPRRPSSNTSKNGTFSSLIFSFKGKGE